VMGQPSDKTGTPSGIAYAAEDPKLREKPAPTGKGIDTPPKVTKLGRETSRPERCCADWVNARLSPPPRVRLHRQKPGTASICPKCPHAVAEPAMQIGPPTRRGTARNSLVSKGLQPCGEVPELGPPVWLRRSAMN